MLNYEFPPLGGGAAVANYYLLSELAKHAAIHVDLITAGSNEQPETEILFDSIRVYRVPVGKAELHFWTPQELTRWFRRALSLARKLVTKQSYDFTHCWSGWPSGWIGYHLRRRLPYLIGLRGSDVPGYNPRLQLLDTIILKRISAHVWQRATAVTAVSEYLKELARKTDRRVSIEVIPNGVDATHFTPRSGTPVKPFTLLYVGRLIKRKGVNFLLKAFSELAAGEPDCRLVLAGDGPDRPYLASFCERQGIAHRVQFLGVVRHAALPDVYRRSSVFVMPAINEAMPNALLEAMASGLPAVTTDTGARELVRNGESGFVVEAGNAHAIKTAVARYLEESELCVRHGRNARALAERRTWQRNAEAYLGIYKNIMARQRSQSHLS
jgi:glycosyltransferase involved in cell wall biosynthesis